MINTRELITDVDFTQPNGVKVIRQPTVIVDHRPSVSKIELNIPGIITIASETDIKRLPEADRSEETISIFTLEKLYTTGYTDENAVDGFLSDIVIFEGVSYTAMSCKNNAQYGFCHSLATKTEQAVI